MVENAVDKESIKRIWKLKMAVATKGRTPPPHYGLRGQILKMLKAIKNSGSVPKTQEKLRTHPRYQQKFC